MVVTRLKVARGGSQSRGGAAPLVGVGRVVLEEFLSITADRDVTLAPGFAWECVNHLQEYGPERLDVVVR